MMPLATELLSVASTNWVLGMLCDLLLEDEEEYFEDEPSPTIVVVEI